MTTNKPRSKQANTQANKQAIKQTNKHDQGKGNDDLAYQHEQFGT